MSGFVFVAPAYAARSNDPYVRQFVRHVAPRIFDNRGHLAADIKKDGAVVMPGMPELARRLPRRRKDESTESLERRRADGMLSILGVWSTLIANTDWGDHRVRDPRGGHLSVDRLAELADHPLVDGHATDRTERALAIMRHAGILPFTKQWRELKPDGKFKSTGPALRRMDRAWFRRLGEGTAEIHKRRCRQANERKEAERVAAERSRRSPEPVRAEIRDIFAASRLRGPLPPAAAAPAPRPRITPPELLEAIRAEHPDWSTSQIFSEAHRRQDTS